MEFTTKDGNIYVILDKNKYDEYKKISDSYDHKKELARNLSKEKYNIKKLNKLETKKKIKELTNKETEWILKHSN